jgi:hypothetical protein
MSCFLSLSSRLTRVTKHQAVKTEGEIEVKLHAFLTSVLKEGEWLASRSDCFISEE